jgi:hypothetical protein
LIRSSTVMSGVIFRRDAWYPAGDF